MFVAQLCLDMLKVLPNLWFISTACIKKNNWNIGEEHANDELCIEVYGPEIGEADPVFK